MNTQTGPMKAILTVTVSAFLLLSACGSDADSALEAAEEVPTAEETATTAGPEEVEVVEEAPTTEVAEAAPGLDPELEEAVAGMTVAWGDSDGDLAWSFDSERCRGGLADAPAGFVAVVADYGATYPGGVTASNITAVVGDDRAAVSYDVYDGAGDFVANYDGQPWILADGKWLRDPC